MFCCRTNVYQGTRTEVTLYKMSHKNQMDVGEEFNNFPQNFIWIFDGCFYYYLNFH